MEIEEKITLLEEFKSNLVAWQNNENSQNRTRVNQRSVWVQREVSEAGCLQTFTVGPPPAVGGVVMQNVNAFDMIFNPPYDISVIPHIHDMIDKTIGVLHTLPLNSSGGQPQVVSEADIHKGYAFIAMQIAPDDPQVEDVLEAIKEAAKRCGIRAERVDEPDSNDRITDRILESIRKAEYVIVDLTSSRPNVFYEAGYAQGIKKTPIYVARDGTKLEFDLKDYPVIFFRGITDLKTKLEKRLRGLSDNGSPRRVD